jgi:hypothetical protein
MIALLCSKIFPGQPYNPDRFRQAVIFGDSLSGNARKLQQAIAKTNGVSVAADLIEEAFGLINKSN